MRTYCRQAFLAVVLVGLALPLAAHTMEIKVSAVALERTLNTQLFKGQDGRYYFRG